MAGILSAFNRGNPQKDPMRESAALTTVYLLEQNQKFEQYMRQKVDELESRVAAQQARLSTREEAREQELWESIDEAAETEMEFVDADETVVEAETEWLAWDDTPELPNDEVAVEVDSAPEPAEVPDYLILMGGTNTSSEAADENDEPTASDPEADTNAVIPAAMQGVVTALENDDTDSSAEEDPEPDEALVAWPDPLLFEPPPDDDTWDDEPESQLDPEQTEPDVIPFAPEVSLNQQASTVGNEEDTDINAETEPDTAESSAAEKTAWETSLADGEKGEWS